MKRRSFVRILGASALSMPFVLTQLGSLRAKGGPAVSSRAKTPLRLKLPAATEEVLGVLKGRSDDLYLLGGSVLATRHGVDVPYVNLLAETDDFQSHKRALYKFGVSPISTPDLPGNFIRFVHNDRGYNVLNLDLGSYSQLNLAGQDNGLILFAHNFLVYSVNGRWVMDPHGALQPRADGKTTPMLKAIQRPKSVVQGFEHCLAGAFDCNFLKLEVSPEFAEMESELLGSAVTGEEASKVMRQVLDYMPDVIEVCGMDTATKLLRSTLCRSAGDSAAGIDFGGVVDSLRQRRFEAGTGGTEFVTAVDTALRQKGKGSGTAFGLTEYMFANGIPIRRTELVVDAMKGMEA